MVSKTPTPASKKIFRHLAQYLQDHEERNEKAWNQLTLSDRGLLVYCAKLPAPVAGFAWCNIAEYERIKILEAIARMSQWARSLKMANERITVLDRVA